MNTQFTELNRLRHFIDTIHEQEWICNACSLLASEEYKTDKRLHEDVGVERLLTYFKELEIIWRLMVNESMQNVLNQTEEESRNYIKYVLKVVAEIYHHTFKVYSKLIITQSDYLTGDSKASVPDFFNARLSEINSWIVKFKSELKKIESSKRSSSDQDVIENEVTHKQQYLIIQYLGIIDFLKEKFPELNKTMLATIIGFIINKAPDRALLTYIDMPKKNVKGKHNARTIENYNWLLKICKDLQLNQLFNKIAEDKARDFPTS